MPPVEDIHSTKMVLFTEPTRLGPHDVDHVDDVARKMARLRSPSKSTASVEKIQQQQLILHQGRVVLKNSGRVLTELEFLDIRRSQRDSRNLYRSCFFFPRPDKISPMARLSDEDRLSRVSLSAAIQFVCFNCFSCSAGDCCSQLTTADVLTLRTSVMTRVSQQLTKSKARMAVIESDLNSCWDRTSSTWSFISVHLDETTTAKMCPISYALCVGSSASEFQAAWSNVTIGISSEAIVQPQSYTINQKIQDKSHDWNMLRRYVASLVTSHECNPAPGAHQSGQTTCLTRKSWKAKWEACQLFFSDAGRVPGSKSMLKKVWQYEKRLKEKRAKSHSKCDICSSIDTSRARLVGINTAKAIEERKFWDKEQALHEQKHLSARAVLDDAGLTAFVNPRAMWCICVDAATQRNFELPKFQFRPPKQFGQLPFVGYKLMATYAYGYGFTPYLVHDSQYYGPNLTFTCLWETVCDMRDFYGFWPEQIHINLDNTKSENKNETMLAILSFLTTKISHVRVFFLPVGHTHIIIDQIFGVITVGLRRQEILLPDDLKRNINTTLARNVEYMAKPCRELFCLYDMTAWGKSMSLHKDIGRLFSGNVQDEHGTYTGMYDFMIKRDADNIAVLFYRESHEHAWWPASGKGALLITKLPSSPPPLAELKSFEKWGKMNSKTVYNTIQVATQYARTCSSGFGEQLIIDEWESIFRSKPTMICLLPREKHLCFRFFEDDVIPRLQHNTDLSDINTRLQDAKDYLTSMVRQTPLAVDPVVSSEQSEKEFRLKLNAMKAAARGGVGPSSNSQAPVFGGEFLLVQLVPGAGIDLVHVRDMSKLQGPRHPDLVVTCTIYEHTPNPDVSGLFGTFRLKMVETETGAMMQSRCKVRRNLIVVVNAQMMPGKTYRLNLETLRCLANAMPEMYPMPTVIPEEHCGVPRNQKSGKGCSQGTGKRQRKIITRVLDSSDEESDEHSDEDLLDESEADVSGIDESDDTSDIDQVNCNETNGKDGSNDSEGDRTIIATSGTPADIPGHVVDSTFPGEGNCLALINCRGCKDYSRMKFPVALVYLTTMVEGRWEAFAYNDIDLYVLSKSERKTVTYVKFWTDSNWMKAEKVTKNKVTTELVMKYWYPIDNGVASEEILPIRISDAFGSRTPNVVRNDTMSIPMEFVKGSIIPILKRMMCMH